MHLGDHFAAAGDSVRSVSAFSSWAEMVVVLDFESLRPPPKNIFRVDIRCSGIKEFSLARRLHSAEATILASNPATPGSNTGSAEIFSLYCLVCEQY